MKMYWYAIVMMLLPGSAWSQADSNSVLADHIWNIDALGSIDVPAGAMAKRFGQSYRIGFGFKNKTRTNWVYGAKFEFIVGNKIKEDSLLYGLTTSTGNVIAQTGDLLNVGIFERGYMVGVQVGRILPFYQLNKNSGPLVLFSTGFMQHRIKLFDKDLAFPQLADAYVKGYDRLTNGWYTEEFIGYNYFATNKLINCYAGLSCVQGFTRGRRDFLFDVKRPDNAARIDMLFGFKIGWVISIYKKASEDTYY